ncbi:uncharacterized protein MELLADRAFT_87248 [Melampsora larici-populina 98AG31]|uniref:Uncharacterized protein n=1 Tax=Melampsora larici-populina (strain 98AG31 / pathotype 3-4-7) TaxID=747676 RepID=F4SDQ9_MELLP|nr:uncharacterized protein MELLADRAFT_87248 [Melampsora larici-populina 98AG31]EGF97220.1 hypothetical protein MELLADRAFT_87248 [Melampsora larici-populina 98AG31]
MSCPVQYHVFLPNYILEYVVNEPERMIDPDFFLSKATPAQIVEVILSFYPYFSFTQNAREDHELLLKIFVEMVAPRLNNIIIPESPTTNYVQVNLHNPTTTVQPTNRWVNSSADIDAKRIEFFNERCLLNLKNGRFRLAALDLERFVEKYKYLNHAEIEELVHAQDDPDEESHEAAANLRSAHESVETIQLLLREPKLSPTSVQELEEQLRGARTSLISYQRAFEAVAKDGAFIHALSNHHRKILEKHSTGQH